VTAAELQRDLLIVACAVSAGIHAALVPEHLTEGAAPGLGFGVAAALLGIAVLALTVRLDDVVVTGTAAILAALLVGYALATTTGVPLLHPTPEPVDGLALFTKTVEVAGVLAAAGLLRRSRHGLASRTRHPEGATT
jgi:hypothetical protein